MIYSDEKLPLLVIGKSASPQFAYKVQPSAWMDQIIFLEYFNKLEKRFDSESRKCILFIDNYPHNYYESSFFPPNITNGYGDYCYFKNLV